MWGLAPQEYGVRGAARRLLLALAREEVKAEQHGQYESCAYSNACSTRVDETAAFAAVLIGVYLRATNPMGQMRFHRANELAGESALQHAVHNPGDGLTVGAPAQAGHDGAHHTAFILHINGADFR